eukprot:scaffold122985_cov24-Tisochrysis_lutea.AAC.3
MGGRTRVDVKGSQEAGSTREEGGGGRKRQITLGKVGAYARAEAGKDLGGLGWGGGQSTSRSLTSYGVRTLSWVRRHGGGSGRGPSCSNHIGRCLEALLIVAAAEARIGLEGRESGSRWGSGRAPPKCPAAMDPLSGPTIAGDQHARAPSDVVYPPISSSPHRPYCV